MNEVCQIKGSQENIGYRLDDMEFESWKWQEILFFSKSSRLPLEPTQPPTQWLSGFFPGGKVARM